MIHQKSHGSTRNYKFGQKNNWRRMLWNEVLRRTDGREKRELILYLAGPQDLDRSVAVSKGVPSRNLIAIDRSADNIKKIRSSGSYGVCADALAVLRAWPQSVSVCAIVLDFCSGLPDERRLEELSHLSALNNGLRGSVLAVNFMRGRDAKANRLRSLVAEIRELSAPDTLDIGHRGGIFYVSHSVLLTGALDEDKPLESIRLIEQTTREMNPKFYSYRSGVLTFDSVVVSPRTVDLVDDGGTISAGYQRDIDVVRKIAATLATRTRQAVACHA